MERLEGTFFAQDGTELFFQQWRGHDPKNYLVITHGLGEHSECYHELASDLAKDDFAVFAWDLRGHGRSEGKRGFVGAFSDLTDDLFTFLNHLKATELQGEKQFSLLGHSLGGLIVLSAVIEKGLLGCQSLVISSPALGVKLEIPAFKRKSAKFLANVLPKITLHNEIDYRDLHSDAQRLKAYEADPLRHDKISPGFFLGIMDAMKNVQIKAGEIHLPTLFQLSGKDRVVDSSAAELIFKSIGSKNKKLYVYPESLHEVYNDIERDRVIADLKSFLRGGGAR